MEKSTIHNSWVKANLNFYVTKLATLNVLLYQWAAGDLVPWFLFNYDKFSNITLSTQLYTPCYLPVFYIEGIQVALIGMCQRLAPQFHSFYRDSCDSMYICTGWHCAYVNVDDEKPLLVVFRFKYLVIDNLVLPVITLLLFLFLYQPFFKSFPGLLIFF